MMRHREEAFTFDIHVRRDVDEKFSQPGNRVVAQDIREGKVYERNGVMVTAFLVAYGPVQPSYGYRVDYAGRSVALSGDTRPAENLVAVCKGVDALIQETIVYREDSARRRSSRRLISEQARDKCCALS
jgi:ribonuclease Z